MPWTQYEFLNRCSERSTGTGDIVRFKVSIGSSGCPSAARNARRNRYFSGPWTRRVLRGFNDAASRPIKSLLSDSRRPVARYLSREFGIPITSRDCRDKAAWFYCDLARNRQEFERVTRMSAKPTSCDRRLTQIPPTFTFQIRIEIPNPQHTASKHKFRNTCSSNCQYNAFTSDYSIKFLFFEMARKESKLTQL